jgi:uncharacterized protein
LYLHGSRARGVARENSDYDIGVVFADPKSADDTKTYLSLYEILSDTFPDTQHGPKLDIALLQRANAKLQLDTINHGTVLFESDPRTRADYEESVIKQYDDYRFLEREYRDATLSAFRAKYA